MRIGLVIAMTLLLNACASGYDPDFSAGIQSGMKWFKSDEKPPKAELNLLVGKMVSEMLSNNQFVGKQNAIAVASIVELKDLATTNRFGNQLSEGIMHYLHDNGFRVVDFKLTGAIQVTEQGDFTHTRNWQNLKGEFAVDYLVSGTMDELDGGLVLNVRMVGLQSQVVVGSAQAFVSKDMLTSFSSEAMLHPDQQMNGAEGTPGGRRVTLENGMITRKQRP